MKGNTPPPPPPPFLLAKTVEGVEKGRRSSLDCYGQYPSPSFRLSVLSVWSLVLYYTKKIPYSLMILPSSNTSI